MLSAIRRRLTAPRDEQGSLIIVLAIISIIVVLGAALMAEVVNNGENTLTRQNTAAAVAAADAGVADALFRIDQGPGAEGNGTEFYLSPSASCSGDSRCIGTSLPGYSNVSYKAVLTGNTTWTVEAVATAGKSTVAVEEMLSRAVAFPYALFGNSGLNFNGNAAQGFGTYSETSPASSSNPDSSSADCVNGVGSSCVAIGSNGTISCSGGIGANVTAVYYSGGGGISGSCGTPDPVGSIYHLTVPTAPTSDYYACPNGGKLGSNQAVSGTVPGVNAPLGAGTYLCSDTQLYINGNLTVNGAVTIDVIVDSATNTTWINQGTSAIDITAGSYVNVPTSGTTMPVAQDLTIATDSTGTVGDSHGQGYYFGGILDAPDSSLTGDGCKSVYYGAAIVNTLTCNGGPHLAFYYDSVLKSDFGPWGETGYTQIDPMAVTIP